MTNSVNWAVLGGEAVLVSNVLTFSNTAVNYQNNDLTNVRTFTFNGEVQNGNSGNAFTVAWASGQKQAITLTNTCTFTFNAPLGPGNFLLRLVQDATGSRTVSWPSVKWPGGSAPTLTTAANAVDIVSFYYNGSTYYGQAGLAFA